MDDLTKLLNKIKICFNYRNLIALEESFNSVGLTIQHTPQNWFVLCKIEDNKPSVKKIMEDFIFLESLDNISNEVSTRVTDCIVEFIQTNASSPSKILNIARPWRNGIRLYGKAIGIVNEDVERALQGMLLESRVCG